MSTTNDISLNSSECPDAYKQGWIEFYNLKFKVTPSVLIPRPETEQIIQEVETFVTHNSNKFKEVPFTLLDVGTGSGCIAVSIAKTFPQARITAIDVSPEALAVAQENAHTHHASSQIEFIQNNLLEDFYSSIDIIVANLPYIPTSTIPNLDISVKDFEPILALDGGLDGLDLYRKMFNQIVQNKLNPKLIVVEIDDFQDIEILKMAADLFPTYSALVKKDFSNLNRYLILSRQ